MAKEKKKVERQDWKPHWSMGMLYKIWCVIFGAIKIALGAAATVALIVGVCVFVLMGVLGDYLEDEILPDASLILENYNMDEPSYVYFINSEGQIEELQKIHSSTDWKNAEYEEIPKALIHAAVAIEDKRFYEHQGVDWFTTVKAFANMFFGDETVGGSSITQQLIKNRTGEDSVTVQRKVLEFFRAALVEKNYDKQTIMELYMNSIYLGQGCRGVKSAAKTYFGKELQMLNIAECASLISITNNPSLFDPYSDNIFEYAGEQMDGRQRNEYRQRLVLKEMLNQEYITQEEYDEAIAYELVFKNGIAEEDRWTVCSNEACDYEGIAGTYTKDSSMTNYICPECGTATPMEKDNSQEVYSYFVDTVLEDVAKQLAQKNGVMEWNDEIFSDYLQIISRSGYHIYSTYDEYVQSCVDDYYKDLEKVPSPRGAQQLQSAMVIVDNETGDIVAMAGGVGDEKEHFGLNRATQSRLQTGSSIKPLTVYAPGFQQGTISPASVIKDLPLTYSGGPYPMNYDRTFNYSYSVLRAVMVSSNAVAAHTATLIGEEYGFEFARDSFGLSGMEDPEDINVASLALGAQHYGVSVRDMTCAFATFANEGVYREGRTFTKVYDSKGNLVLDNTQDAKTILNEKANTYMNYCLDNAANYGTGTGALISGQRVAGKTGTTSSSRDQWFCGYTSHYTAAVWTGYDTPAVISWWTNPACYLWKNVMQPVHEGLEYQTLYSTNKMTTVSVCLDSGMLATDACRADIRGSRVESAMVYPEDRPSGSCTQHVMMDYCTSGGGVANEYCKKFAGVDSKVTIEKKALLKLTTEKYNEIVQARGAGLLGKYTGDAYVYLTDNDGNDGNYKGFSGSINKTVKSPYKGCTVHTEAAWLEHEAKNPPKDPSTPGEPSTPTTPSAPTTPDTPTNPATP